MESKPCAVNATREAVRLLLGLLLNTICSITIGLLVVRGRSDILALVIKDIAAQVEAFAFSRGGRRGGAVCGWESLAGGDGRVRTRLEWLQSAGSIGNNAEVAGKWWSNIRRAGLRINLDMLAGFRNAN
jgi:hypothetical protein